MNDGVGAGPADGGQQPQQDADKGFGNLVDRRVITKPGRYDGKETAWLEWEFQFCNYVAMAAPELLEFLDGAAGRRNAIEW